MPDWRTIRELSETHQIPTCLFEDPSETSKYFIGDPYNTGMPHWRLTDNIIISGDISETHVRLTCLIGDPSKTNMPDRRPIGDLYMLLWSPKCPIGDQHV